MDIIYILINEAIPGYVKIGRTSNLEQRIRDLDTAGVPLPFECFYACTVRDAVFVETQLFEAFSTHRLRPRREFFEIAPESAVAALKLAEIENVTPKKDFVETPEDQQALNLARMRRATFNFQMVNIPVGAELVFSRDENIKAKVINNRSIEYNGAVTSLSESARSILNNDYPVAGTYYWKFEGETLDERRRRLENEA
ncbi:MAG: GIY-YIG nuclease family protein [Elusimicrobia bacterium]|nr:GIY-YIG nuclease family protein [Elusimicrobiota bacterium]